MSNMQLVPRGRSWRELVATKIADRLIVAGRWLHARWAVVPEPPPSPNWVWSEQWRTGVLQFCFFGDRLNFAQRRMFDEGICTRDTWKAYTDLLVAAGVMVKIERAGCFWAHMWNRHRLGVELRHGLALPYPITPAPPMFNTLDARTQTAQHSTAPQLSAVWSKDVPRGPRVKGE